MNTDNDIELDLIRLQLINLRKSRHMTQKQLSELSGLSISCISNIESESGSPRLSSLIKYVHALNGELYLSTKN